MNRTIRRNERSPARAGGTRLTRVAGVLGILAAVALILAGSGVAQAQQPVTSPASAPQSGPLTPARTLSVTVYMHGTDHELGFGSNETGERSQTRTANFTRWGDSQQISFEDLCVGDEVVVRVSMEAVAAPTGGITLTGSAQLLEGDDCQTADVEDTEAFNLYAPPNGQRVEDSKDLANTGFGGGDTGIVKISAINGPFVGAGPRVEGPRTQSQVLPAEAGRTITCTRNPVSTNLICAAPPQPGDALAITWYSGFDAKVEFTATFLGEDPANSALWRLRVTAVGAEYRNVPILGVPLQEGVIIPINPTP
jgi:hypothetical protein